MRNPVPEAARMTLCVLILWANASVTLADDVAPVITPEEVRAFYEKEVTGVGVLPKVIQYAFVAAEDPTFHHEDATLSQISQRLAQWMIPPGLDMVSFKMRELSTTIAVEEALSKEEILGWYLARIYLGRGCYGVEAASAAYFGRKPDALTLAEAAMLAGLASAPAFDPERALARRNLVLAEMAKAGFVTAATAAESSLQAIAPPGRCDG
jgi:membrane carboxypeptidase/penicillin-binding protein PbpC